MKFGIASAVVCLLALPSIAGELYNNGPINGTTDAWTINFNFVISDSFTISGGTSTITQLSFGAWLFPGDILESVEVSFTSEPYGGGGTTYFDQVVNFTQSACSTNQYSFNVCTETGSFNGPTLGNGTYWLNLQNAVSANGDPVYWDENSGVGCTSPGCPSIAYVVDCIQDGLGCIPSESFTLSGDTGATVPEPSSAFLLGSGLLTTVGTIKRRFRK